MEGYIGIDISTKRYVSAYMANHLTNGNVIDCRDSKAIGLFFIQCLQDKRRFHRVENFTYKFPTVQRVYISKFNFRNYGPNLSQRSIADFNTFMETIIKNEFRTLMIAYVLHLKKIDDAIEAVRCKINITEEDWSYDAMRRDYYRFRDKLPNSSDLNLYKRPTICHT